jgi:hypothetical protein
MFEISTDISVRPDVIPTEKQKIEKFRKVDAGEPFSKISSS